MTTTGVPNPPPQSAADHTRLLCNINELNGLFQNQMGLNTFLQQAAQMTAEHMQADVCSIYLYHEDTKELVLKATKGLQAAAIDRVRMKLGEGLTGKALKELRPVNESIASTNCNYKYFPGIGEERYPSFLGIPILRGLSRIGVFVIQSMRENAFSQNDINAFEVVSSQLAHTIETAKILIEMNDSRPPAPPEKPASQLKLVKGKTGASGSAVGTVSIYSEKMSHIFLDDTPTESTLTRKDFLRAVDITRDQLRRLQTQIEETLYDVASLIFAAQILMLQDQSFMSGIIARIDDGTSPEMAIKSVVNHYVRRFNEMDNPYLKEKAHDVMDVGKRLLENLTGTPMATGAIKNSIVIAQELFPSDTLKLFSEQAKGIVILKGGVTSHLSILCRSLNIPLVIADESALLTLPAGTRVLLDATQGNIHIAPTDELLASWQATKKLEKQVSDAQHKLPKRTMTTDHVPIQLFTNINLLGDMAVANQFNTCGVGMYRTEFPFLVRNDFPSEEEQYAIYSKLIAGMAPKPVIFRTLDIGGDKFLSYDNSKREDNPFLGLRSIRFSLLHRDLFTQQIKAILRAAAGTDSGIMFPMISSLEELLQTLQIVDNCKASLAKENQPYQSHPKIGIMIELPSIISIIDDIAPLVDFFSVGTNDLTQYMLAVDRTNERMADLYLTHHPAVLRALDTVATAARRHNRPITICGDMAHEPAYIPFLLGIGITRFSLDAGFIPEVQRQIISIDIRDCQTLASRVLREASVEKIASLLGLSSSRDGSSPAS